MRITKKKIKGTKYFSPYDNKGACTLKSTGAGVYIIRDDKKRICYVGMSLTDVKKTMYRHFQKWIDKRHPNTKAASTIERVTYKKMGFDGYTCKVYFLNYKQEVLALEQLLILTLKPSDNSQKILTFDKEIYMSLKSKLKEQEVWNINSEEDPF